MFILHSVSSILRPENTCFRIRCIWGECRIESIEDRQDYGGKPLRLLGAISQNPGKSLNPPSLSPFLSEGRGQRNKDKSPPYFFEIRVNSAQNQSVRSNLKDFAN